MTEKKLQISQLLAKDFDKLLIYLSNLSLATRSRFAPHRFDLVAIEQFYLPENNNIGYIITDIETQAIIAYSIIKLGYVLKDKKRFEENGIQLYPQTDCTFAPSVADAWQSKGLGKMMFDFLKIELQKQSLRRIFLWGGVQATNETAINYYLKNSFEKIGSFEKNGIDNFDMIMHL
ncbi:GNAT family N-acetyltransferase [Emticicia sp. SJ17W-69]|uniref:GNAT family N-acetyltransferase n=1 Tax=Emticicia sp. SJ17W-69 TaxID=3421657 RepID=UPI003EBA0F85